MVAVIVIIFLLEKHNSYRSNDVLSELSSNTIFFQSEIIHQVVKIHSSESNKLRTWLSPSDP